MKILVACESSGKSRDALIALGHDAMSCDLLETDAPGPHYKGDVRDVLHEQWDGMIAHPDCTYVSGSGWHWVARGRIEADGRPRLAHAMEAVAFARMLMEGPEVRHIPRRAIENPVGRLSTLIRKPDQIIQPHQFGDDASKATCLWLYGLPLLVATKHVAPRMVCCGETLPDHLGKYGCPNCGGEKVARPRWANQTNSGQNVLPPTADRWKLRSETYPGVASAWARQWFGDVRAANDNTPPSEQQAAA